MKLNNKGFAFSTMLYGTLALLTLVLYVVLDVSKNSYDETYFYGDEIRIKLNECIDKELYLEKCYSSGNLNCDTTLYHSCLGVSDDTTVPQGTLMAVELKNNKVTSGNGLYQDSYNTDRYVFKGDSVNNYLLYAGKKWRIVSVEAIGTIKLIDYSNPIQIKWNSGGTGGLLWKNCDLYKYLDGTYKASITAALGNDEWNATIVYPSKKGTTPNFSITSLNSLKDEEGDLAGHFASVGVLSIDDIMKASTNSTCQNNMLNATGCNSWLANYGGWTTNIDAEASGTVYDGNVQIGGTNGTTLVTSYVYFFDNSAKKLIVSTVGETRVAYPVVYLGRNAVFNGGNGTEGNPYTLK